MSGHTPQDLGSLGFVAIDIPDEPERLFVSMSGRQYCLVWGKIERGQLIERPADERLFDSMSAARAALAKAKGEAL